MSYNGQILKKCKHTDQTTVKKPDPKQCQECVELGDTWNHLRTCLVCGFVGCCGASKNQHTNKHNAETGHPIYFIEESGGNIAYCYDEGIYFKI